MHSMTIVMRSAFKSIRDLWRRFTRRSRVDRVVFVVSRRELPADLGKSLYVVGENPPRWAVLNCPCGCGERTNAKVGVVSRTSWALAIREGKATLAPSLLMPNDRCGSHFFVRENRILWV
jgi:hypothetical protein